MTDIRSADPVMFPGACHCGAVKFTAELPLGLASARRCTCSICRMRGAVAVTSTHDGFTIHEGADKLATYRFNTKKIAHHFCPTCGCAPFASGTDPKGGEMAAVDTEHGANGMDQSSWYYDASTQRLIVKVVP